jgi:hypothetical protein
MLKLKSLLILLMCVQPLMLKAASVSSETAEGHSVRVGYGPLYGSYSHASTGFKVSTPASLGEIKTLEGRTSISDDIAVRARFRHQNVLFKNIPDTSPNQVRVIRNHYNLSAVTAIGSGYTVGGGLFFEQRLPSSTAPTEIVTKIQETGLAGSFAVPFQLSDIFVSNTRVEFEVPLIFRELGPTSGSYNSAYNLEFGTDISHTVNSWQELSLGLSLRQSKIFYQGVGERGSRSATDTQVDFWFPIEIRISF